MRREHLRFPRGTLPQIKQTAEVEVRASSPQPDLLPSTFLFGQGHTFRQHTQTLEPLQIPQELQDTWMSRHQHSQGNRNVKATTAV